MPPVSPPAVRHWQPGALVLDFIDGRTLTPADVRDRRQPRASRRSAAPLPPRDPAALPRPGAALLGLPGAARLCPYASADAAAPPSSSPPPRTLEAATGPVELVFGHNDLLAGQPPRRRRAGSGWSTGTMPASTRRSSTSAASPPTARWTPDAAEALLEAYFGRPVDDELRRRAAAMTRRLAAARDAVEHGLGAPFRHRLRLCRLYRREPRPLRRAYAAFRGRMRMTDLPVVRPSSSSSAAASSAARPPIISARWADRRRAARARTSSPRGSTWHAAGPRRPAPHQRQRHPAPRLFGRALRPAGGGDRARHRLEAERRPAARLQRRALDRGPAARRPPPTRFGLEMQLLTPREAQDLWPLMDGRRRDRRRLPADRRPGLARPTSSRRSPAARASAGVDHPRGLAVTGIHVEAGRVAGVVTDRGRDRLREARPLRRPVVARARRAGRRQRAAGLGAAPVSDHRADRRRHAATCRRCATPTGSPTTRRRSAAWSWAATSPTRCPGRETGIPEDFAFQLLENDWDHFEPMMELALGRVPALETAGVKQLHQRPRELHARRQLHPRRGARGAEPLRRRRLQRLRHRLGRRRRHGAGRMGRRGRAALRPLAGRHPPLRRNPPRHELGPHAHAGGLWPSTTRWPGRTRNTSPAGRSAARRSTTGCSAQGACFGEKLGWERPNWFAAAGEAPPRHPLLRAARTGSPPSAREHRAAREARRVFDQTSFAKFLLTGRDAEAALSWICANDVARPPGSADLHADAQRAAAASNATSPSPGSPRTPSTSSPAPALPPTTSTGSPATSPTGLDARLVDVTSAVRGPRADGPARPRHPRSRSPRTTSRNAAFPFGTCAALAVAGAPVLALRITYVGELGWELHVPVEFAADRLRRADGRPGAPHGIANAGYRAIESLRLEKGYRAWGADIGPDHSPLMAGLGWAVKLARTSPFLGREALEAQAAQAAPPRSSPASPSPIPR